jgi:hypothetical protein
LNLEDLRRATQVIARSLLDLLSWSLKTMHFGRS